MRIPPLSMCERSFILKAVSERKRLDGRELYDYRNIRIIFGLNSGDCVVHLGSTSILCSVSCEVVVPHAGRPNEGKLEINVELSQMAAPNFEPGRSDAAVELNRLLEKCIKQSRCIDQESLCIVSGEKVWSIRVDLTVLNHDGNIADCACIAAMAGLSHFKRPDVSIAGENVIIHTVEERNPVSLHVNHVPVCVTFAFFDQGKGVAIDPTDIEERVMDGKMTIGMNKYREICSLHLSGTAPVNKQQIMMCTEQASGKAKRLVDIIQKALEDDAIQRKSRDFTGFAGAVWVKRDLITVSHRNDVDMEVDETDLDQQVGKFLCTMRENIEEFEATRSELGVLTIEKGTAEIGYGLKSAWATLNDGDDDAIDIDSRPPSANSDGPSIVPLKTEKASTIARRPSTSSESEEETTAVISGSFNFGGKDLMAKSMQAAKEKQAPPLKKKPLGAR